jgi:hypothetical protein
MQSYNQNLGKEGEKERKEKEKTGEVKRGGDGERWRHQKKE